MPGSDEDASGSIELLEHRTEDGPCRHKRASLTWPDRASQAADRTSGARRLSAFAPAQQMRAIAARAIAPLAGGGSRAIMLCMKRRRNGQGALQQETLEPR